MAASWVLKDVVIKAKFLGMLLLRKVVLDHVLALFIIRFHSLSPLVDKRIASTLGGSAVGIVESGVCCILMMGWLSR